MKKKKYSLTAKERKAIRAKNSGKPAPPEPIDPCAPAEGEAEVAVNRINKKTVVVVTAVILAAVILITAAILIPILVIKYRYHDVNNPVARMELSNGMVIEYELFEDTCPIAASNFIFLARIGYFNGTIIFDIQNNWMRFGGYETEVKHRSTNKEFTDKVQTSEKYPKSKFGYRLKADTSADAKTYNQKGVLAFMYNDSATEFQIASVDGAQTTIQTPNSNKDYRITACGRVLNEESMENVETITGMEKNVNSASTIWKPPAQTITIKRIKIYNLDRKKWKNFAFDDYFEDYISQWTNTD